MGILVTVCTAPRSQRLRMVFSPSAPKVPMTVAISAALTASTTELRREVSASSSANSSRYHFSDTPVKDAETPALVEGEYNQHKDGCMQQEKDETDIDTGECLHITMPPSSSSVKRFMMHTETIISTIMISDMVAPTP